MSRVVSTTLTWFRKSAAHRRDRRRRCRPAAAALALATAGIATAGPAVAALALFGTLAAARPAAAVSFALSERQQAEAVRVGAESMTADSVGSEWTMTGEAGEAAVITPFHRLAVAARQAAFKGRSLAAAEIQQILKEDRERLVFWVSLWGPSADFARFYQPVIVVAANEVKAAWVQNERTAARQPDGRYLARCVYAFATSRLEPTTRGILSVRGQDGREVAAFGFDLATMR